ncbi:hypothetical protein [Salirhabdus sp. Marseille-P4669]|uniref:hypothetical protein n=1 Tax=Salirhabdus sp. Marseille-P4669 TaxID=2042310 RepID=UPI000C7C32CA|nr:hypothetical protein [Salirhabdus sp. Marseille-P4669]
MKRIFMLLCVSILIVLIGCKESSSSSEKVRNELEGEPKVQQQSSTEKYQDKAEKPIEEMGEQEDSRILGVYNPGSVMEGTQVSGLTVENVNIEKQGEDIQSYIIAFNGELELIGSVSLDEAHGGYVFTVNNEHFTFVPHTMEDVKNGTISFKIKNEDVFKEAVGVELSSGESKIIHAIFNDYTSTYLAESHSSDFATFIELIID